MKYKVGDKVRVRKLGEMINEYGIDDYGNIAIPGCYFVPLMKEFCEKIVTIKTAKTINGQCLYEIEEDGLFYWNDCMFEPVSHYDIMFEQLREINKKKFTSCVTYDVDELYNSLDNALDEMKKKIDEYDKEINNMKKETKQPKQKTKRELLEEKIAKYQVGSGIESIEIIVPNKVVKIKMDSMFSHWKNEYKMVCDDQDTFSLERAIYLAYAKDGCCGKYTSKYIELYADKLAMEKKFVARVKAAMKLYKCQEELKRLDEEEAAMIQKKKEKRWKQKERRAERKRNEQIAMQKEAYVQAWKEIEKLKKSNENKVDFTNDQDIRL